MIACLSLSVLRFLSDSSNYFFCFNLKRSFFLRQEWRLGTAADAVGCHFVVPIFIKLRLSNPVESMEHDASVEIWCIGSSVVNFSMACFLLRPKSILTLIECTFEI